MINLTDIMETINMISEENLDIRTITMGISLLDCADSDADKAWKKGERFEYAIYDIKNKDFLGVIGVIKRGKERNQAIELGYWLKKDAQGYGYMQEAVKLVEDEFFSLGIQRITIRVDVENEKSNKFAIKAGYSFEGKLRKGHYNMCLHQFRDLNLYSKIKNN